jgi:hypothetical protein
VRDAEIVDRADGSGQFRCSEPPTVNQAMTSRGLCSTLPFS